MNRRLAAAGLAAVAALAVTAPAAGARHRKPLSGTFAASGLVPYPQGGQCDAGGHDRDRASFPLKVPEAGKLAVEITGFAGDYDVVVTDDKGSILAEGNNETSTSGGSPNTGAAKETLRYTAKRAMTMKIMVCNYLASPEVKGSYTFTFAR